MRDRPRGSGRDFQERFTAQGTTIYAIALDWPAGGELQIAKLGTGPRADDGKFSKVTLLGSPAPPPSTRDEAGLKVSLPKEKPCDHALVLKIEE